MCGVLTGGCRQVCVEGVRDMYGCECGGCCWGVGAGVCGCVYGGYVKVLVRV